MRAASFHGHLPIFRCHSMIWVVLVALVWSLFPTVGLAQQSTAQLLALKGTALVNGQPAAQGVALKAGDVIVTQASASVVLELSDGSQIEVGESTQLDVAELLAADTGARTSRLKLAWGWVRAKLSPDYNKGADATFEIETPNALVGVKFSPPDTRVSYDPEKKETVAKGFHNMLDVLNKLTGERITAPVGATVTITATGIIVAGASAFSAKALAVTALVGAAAAGGIMALQPGAEEKETEWSFTGIFKVSEQEPDFFLEKTFDLTQAGTDLKGTFSYNQRDTSGRVTVLCQSKTPVRGTVTDTNRAQVYPATPYVRCSDGYTIHFPNPFDVSLTDNGNTLVVENSEWEGTELQRQ